MKEINGPQIKNDGNLLKKKVAGMPATYTFLIVFLGFTNYMKVSFLLFSVLLLTVFPSFSRKVFFFILFSISLFSIFCSYSLFLRFPRFRRGCFALNRSCLFLLLLCCFQGEHRCLLRGCKFPVQR